MLDSLIIVPFEPATSVMLEPHMRSTYLAQIAIPLETATIELEDHLGISLNYWEDGRRPTIGGRELSFPQMRTLTSVALASSLECAGLSWHAVDPGVRELDWWRQQLTRMQSRSPRTVAVSSTFIMNYPW